MNRIVVGVDGSPAAGAAARWAAREAVMRNLELTVVCVVPAGAESLSQIAWPATALPAAATKQEVAQGQKILQHALGVIAKTTGPDKPPRITASLYFGALIPTLCQLTRKPTEMIVIGRRVRGAVHRCLHGWVSNGVVDRAPCPVAMICNDHPLRIHPPHAPVVVGIGRSAEVGYAAAIGFDEASRRAVDVVAVHAVGKTSSLNAPVVVTQQLDGWRERYPNVGVHWVITGAHPVHAMLDQSERAQLVVIGSRRHAGFTVGRRGSVSVAVGQSCHAPVIIAHRHPGRGWAE
jgi:nucleotide-binding universal stress UspA family protein